MPFWLKPARSQSCESFPAHPTMGARPRFGFTTSRMAISYTQPLGLAPPLSGFRSQLPGLRRLLQTFIGAVQYVGMVGSASLPTVLSLGLTIHHLKPSD